MQFYLGSDGDPLIAIDIKDLHELLLNAAATIIAFCKTTPADGTFSDDVTKVMGDNTYGSMLMRVGGMVQNADLLYAFVERVCHVSPVIRPWIPVESKIVPEALSAFQTWKDAFVKYIGVERIRGGKELKVKNYTVYNKRFLHLFGYDE